MAIFLTKDNKVIVQGITGSEATVHTARMLKAGTQIVGGVNASGRGSIEDAMTLESPNGQVITGSVRLVHAAGMHARPAVKLTKLAKKFQAQISIRASDAAEWINAKSIAKVMALRAARDSIIQIKASGEDAEGAVAALVDLVAADFPDNAS